MMREFSLNNKLMMWLRLTQRSTIRRMLNLQGGMEMSIYEELTPTEAFLSVHDGLVYVEKQNYNCPEGCWGRAITQNKNIYLQKRNL